MIIKYSNKVKQKLSSEEIYEVIQLSYSIVPYQKRQIFSFSQCSPTQTCILHRIPSTNQMNRIILERKIVVDEDVFLFRSHDTIYLFMESEY